MIIIVMMIIPAVIVTVVVGTITTTHAAVTTATAVAAVRPIPVAYLSACKQEPVKGLHCDHTLCGDCGAVEFWVIYHHL